MLDIPTQDSAASIPMKWEAVVRADFTQMIVGIFGYIWLRDYNSRRDTRT